MKPDLTVHLGRLVHVVVDRSLGSVHPRHLDIRYTVNSGELPGTVSGDGAPIDVYLVGWDVPLREVDAEVVAVVVRANDDEDKLIAVPPGTTWRAEELERAVRFQERFFESTVLV